MHWYVVLHVIVKYIPYETEKHDKMVQNICNYFIIWSNNKCCKPICIHVYLHDSYNAGCWGARNEKLKLVSAETHKMPCKFYVF